MYESFYSFREKPFSLLPDPEFLFLGEKHSAALSMLDYGVMNQAGFTVIVGEIGCGKTTLIRHLLNHLEQDVTVGLMSNTQQAMGELLQWVLMAFGLDYRDKQKVELYEIFVEFMIAEYANNRRTVLIIDEAQNMSAETLEELRMLSNINADKDQVLQLILIGQPQLHATLRRPELEQFAQRIAVDYYLEHLDEAEVAQYIRHRLRVAGGDPYLFSAEACRAVWRYSKGVPRLINVICDTALVYGYAAQTRTIDEALVNEVARDKMKGGLFFADEADLGAQGEATAKAFVMDEPIRVQAESQRVAPAELSRETARELFSGLRRRK